MNNNYDKTEFLFESDAEKIILKEAAKKPKNKSKKILIVFIILFLFIIFTSIYTLNLYQKQVTLKLSANAYKTNLDNFVVLNKYSSSLKTYNNNYNDKYVVIVNNANIIDEKILKNYNLVNVEDNLYDGIKLEEITYRNYKKLKENLAERNYYINIVNGYSSLELSDIVYKNFKIKKGEDYAQNNIEKKGASEHNLGIAFDFTISSNKFSLNSNYDSKEYSYLENIAYLYGFIIRYPKNKEKITGHNYEPYHLRFVGTELAKYLKKNNLTLEEYYELKS